MLFLDRVRVVGVLVVFFENYAESAFHEFQKIIKKIDKDGLILVISNNPSLVLDLPPDVVFLNGDNRLHEFGAWQLGINYLRRQQDFEDFDLFFFANDTLCHHHPMGFVERLAFTLSARSVVPHGRGRVSGALSTMGKSFRLNGVDIKSWISTYLFSLDRRALNVLNWQIHDSYDAIERWVPGGSDESHFFAPMMDKPLRIHMTAWLFGRAGLPKWYKADHLNPSNSEFFKAKALAIICEKALMSRLIQGDVDIFPVFESKVVRVFFRLAKITKKIRRHFQVQI